ncbi:MAG: hypothetical protein IRZ04_11825 [Rhodospirillales bacterium]|nr:hypothetical protein [Rhodospirillales bacterium]
MADNLDLACARLGFELSQVAHQKDGQKQLEGILRDAEAVLEERGPYALFLYLENLDRQKRLGPDLRTKCLEFLREQSLVEAQGDWKQALQALAQDLDSLLYARDLLRRALIYGFEHVRARA